MPRVAPTGAVMANLGLVAARLHGAPAARLVLAQIEKQPAAIFERALMDVFEIAGGEKRRGRLHHQPDDAIEGGGVRVEGPVAGGRVGRALDPRVREQRRKEGVEGRERLAWNRTLR